jgi:hypothetical protein
LRDQRVRTAVILVAVVLAALATFWLATGSAGRRDPVAASGGPARARRVFTAPPRAPALAAAPVVSQKPAAAPATRAVAEATPEPGRPRPGPGYAMELMRRYSVEELDLLARAQRAVRGEPPEDIFAIAEAHRRGADADELVTLVEDLPGPAPLQAAARGWLRSVGAAPELSAPPPAATRRDAFRMGALQARE